MSSTIFAQATGAGKAGVAVFRISGPEATNALSYLGLPATLEPRKVHTHHLTNITTQEIIDYGVVIYFAAPHSFTGEDIIELQVHGSIAVAKILTSYLLTIPNFRLAEPGEFAKRAFFNHKMDLTAAEGLADLIDAETAVQHNQAMRQFDGELARTYEAWRLILLKSVARVEAYLDFPEEEIPAQVLEQAQSEISRLIAQLTQVLSDEKRGEKLRQGLSLVIVGSPNVGKSSLNNYLAKREAAIVSAIPGTTRDIVESYIDIAGYPIVLRDTAGIHKETTDLIEQVGIRLAKQAVLEADIKILLCDYANFEQTFLQFTTLIDDRTIVAINKVDLATTAPALTGIQHPVLYISVKERIGLDDLRLEIIRIAKDIIKPHEPLFITRLRHQQQLRGALDHLEQANLGADLVLAAEDLRLAARSLSMLTGKIEVEEILGEIFANFCIGK